MNADDPGYKFVIIGGLALGDQIIVNIVGWLPYVIGIILLDWITGVKLQGC